MARATDQRTQNRTKGPSPVKSETSNFARLFLAQARHSLLRHHLPRISRCLRLLSEKEIWWRPNPASNSVGNLVLHLAGNVRQWIVSGLGGEPDRRERDKEFAEHGPVPRRMLLGRLRKTVGEAYRVLEKLTERDLERVRSIQGYHVTGLVALYHVTEHFAYHSGQIIYVTKLRLRTDLRFTRLPGEKKTRQRSNRLPAI